MIKLVFSAPLKKMAITTLMSSSLNTALHYLPSTSPCWFGKASICQASVQTRLWKPINFGLMQRSTAAVALIGAGLSLSLLAPGSAVAAVELQLLGLDFSEPSNALSLPTWAIHVSSVVEWITAMALVWQYGEKTGYETWKGLSWGMVPLLGGAFCACTWHFFYNAESLEVLVAIQAALTVIGNATMCAAAFRIYKASIEESKNT